MAYLIGIATALVVSLFATFVGLDRDRAFYPTVLAVVASYYCLFAVMGGSFQALLIESSAMFVFLAATVLGFRRNLWLIAGALSAHGVFDLVHGHLISNPGVPPWWPAFCLTFDLAAAGYLAWLLRHSRLTANAP
ncbi:MAG TPA: hypothetical protein VF319_16180 [Caldimonas sp.]